MSEPQQHRTNQQRVAAHKKEQRPARPKDEEEEEEETTAPTTVEGSMNTVGQIVSRSDARLSAFLSREAGDHQGQRSKPKPTSLMSSSSTFSSTDLPPTRDRGNSVGSGPPAHQSALRQPQQPQQRPQSQPQQQQPPPREHPPPGRAALHRSFPPGLPTRSSSFPSLPTITAATTSSHDSTATTSDAHATSLPSSPGSHHRHTLNQYQQPWLKEGWLLKLSGYLWKTWEPRYFRLKRNRLAYYLDEEDMQPKRVIELDGCTVTDMTLSASGAGDAPLHFSLLESARLPPHTYYLGGESAEELDEWRLCIERASTFFMEIVYVVITNDIDRILEYCPRHWASEFRTFSKLVDEVLLQKRYRFSFVENVGRNQASYTNDRLTYRAYYLLSGNFVYICILDKRMEGRKPEAFLWDICERFESLSACSALELQPFVETLKQLVEIYSPGGYSDVPKNPELVLNAERVLDDIDNAKNKAK
ncbi:Pleckstrin y domain-containing H member 2 [Balamuthia mandrillaris]